MGGILLAAATTTQTPVDPAVGLGLLLGLLISLFLMYKCAVNGRWGFFILGFFCGFLWLAGWMMGPRRPTYR